MSAHTLTGRARTLTLWAGRLIVVVSAAHLLFFLVTSLDFVPDWASGALWEATAVGEPPPAEQGAFFRLLGSFAVPLLLVGLLLWRSAAREQALPGYVTWTVAGWSLLCALIQPASGFPLLVVASVLLVLARRAAPHPGRDAAR
ncbi:DUF6463 family protein [Actinophytocola gossypii]|uniref:Uncharacterized protein n=1 Tax=Actinophytocola gossypii TaxID=2812003 RepID=A0ABT2J2Z0_9PSEU|nr:DUF6463 family protein [Actinophytocola gossypii]MCT2581664.1 hypothetical protein [Actinophytocola gossypii]